MQNTKMQTLWQLCQELREKRQQLVEKMHSNQTYLDHQQNLMRNELLGLRQQNHSLETDLGHLYQHLENLQQHWVSHVNQPAIADPSQQAFQEFRFAFQSLAAEQQVLKQLLPLLTAEQQTDYTASFESLEAALGSFQADYEQWQSSGLLDAETLGSHHQFLSAFHPNWAAMRQQMVAELLESSFAAPAEDPALSAQLAQLQADYSRLQDELEDLHSQGEDREQSLQAALQTVAQIEQEFQLLRTSNNQLAGDLANINEQTDRLIGMVEAYRQAAVAAAEDAEARIAEAEAQLAAAQQAQPVAVAEAGVEPSAEAESDESEDSGSKAEAAREAVRKKVSQVLRHRFGKAPRKVTSGLKEVSNNKALDKLFDFALECDSLDAFETELAAQ